MKAAKIISIAILLIVVFAAAFANQLTSADYAYQFREVPNAGPSSTHLLGTDDLGRDRFSRILHGTRISLLLAPAAALISVILAALVGGFAGFLGGWPERIAMAVTDLFLCLPWLFLLLIVRSLLPLNTSPLTSVLLTFLVLGLLGWAAAARVLCTEAREFRNSDVLLQARATGQHGWRLMVVQLVPKLKPVLLAQFWISIPVFILSEANLGILGLGVAEPLPSWGSLLRELESFSSISSEWWKLVPLILLVTVVTSFQVLLSREEISL
jgi:peptide/nickel transport system permease protein